MLWRVIRAVCLAVVLIGSTAAAPVDALAQDRRVQIDLAQVLEQARAAFREGDLERAIGLYRVVVQFDPDNRIARIELSFALAALGDRERAARLLQDLDTEGLDPDVIAAIGQIVGPERFNLFVIPEVFLDTNINGQTTDATVDTVFGPIVLDDNALGRDGFGYGLTAGGVYRVPGVVPATVTAGVRVLDFEQTRDDEARIFSTVSFGIDLGRVDLLPSASGAYRFRDGDRYEAEISAGLAVPMDLRPVRNTIGVRAARIFGQGEFEDLRDREIYEFYDTVSVGFSDIAVQLEGRFFREDWQQADTFDNDGFIVGLDTILVRVPWVQPTVGGSFTYRDFENVFPLFGVKRLDREYEGHIELLFREIDVFGSNPFVRYEYTDIESNIGLFDFDRHEFLIGVRVISW